MAEMTFRRRVREAVESRLARMRGKPVKISGPAYGLLQAIDVELRDRKSYNGATLAETRLVLLEVAAALEEMDHTASPPALQQAVDETKERMTRRLQGEVLRHVPPSRGRPQGELAVEELQG